MESLALVHPLPQLVVGLMDARRVQQNILQRAAGDHAGDAGAGGLGFGSDDSHLLADQTVGQAGFADVRSADHGYKDRRGVVMLLHWCCVFQN